MPSKKSETNCVKICARVPGYGVVLDLKSKYTHGLWSHTLGGRHLSGVAPSVISGKNNLFSYRKLHIWIKRLNYLFILCKGYKMKGYIFYDIS